MKQRIGYSGAQIALHWTIAVLILFNYIYSDGMGRALHARLENSDAQEIRAALEQLREITLLRLEGVISE